MNEKGNNFPLSLSEFFRTGKMDNDFIISDKYITGICLIYPERSASEHEYMIREKSIVELGDRGLSICVQEAKNLACEAAIKHLQVGCTIPSPVQATPTAPKNETQVTKTVCETDTPQAEVPVASQKDKAETPVKPPSSPVQDKQEVTTPPERDREDLSPEEYGDDNVSGDAVRVNLNDLRPASSLLSNKQADEKQDTETNANGEVEEAKQFEKAKNTVITVCGKLHDCYQWTAGRILDENPIYIVELAQRYDGPRTEEKSALQTLYHEAVRRCNAAA